MIQKVRYKVETEEEKRREKVEIEKTRGAVLRQTVRQKVETEENRES